MNKVKVSGNLLELFLEVTEDKDEELTEREKEHEALIIRSGLRFDPELCPICKSIKAKEA